MYFYVYTENRNAHIMRFTNDTYTYGATEFQRLTRTGLCRQAHTGPITYFEIRIGWVPHERST